MSFYDLSEFFKLSSVLNYNLSATSLNRYNVLTYIIGDKRFDVDDQRDRELKSIVMEALEYLFSAYSQKRRRLGPMAVLHPLRATALLTRSLDNLRLVDLLATLFHDILEDINPLNFDTLKWKDMEQGLYTLLGRLLPDEEYQLIQRMVCLTRTDQESYYQYIGRLLEDSAEYPEIVPAKLADRLDNTLDMRIDLEDPLAGIDFFKTIFQLLFVSNYSGYRPKMDHPPTSALNGARRLFQLFKNAVLLSLIRQYTSLSDDRSLKILFDAVADASLIEAQRTLMHLIGYHHKDLQDQRKLVLEAMQYCFSGRSDFVTRPDVEQLLDGLFSTYFGHTQKRILNQQLDMLYQNKPLMIQASITFIVIFLSFLNDSGFYVKGISAEGIAPT